MGDIFFVYQKRSGSRRPTGLLINLYPPSRLLIYDDDVPIIVVVIVVVDIYQKRVNKIEMI